MPINYTIDIDNRTVLVVVRQYDSAGKEVSISNIIVPESAAEQRRVPDPAELKCPTCKGVGLTFDDGFPEECSECHGTVISNRSAGR